MRRVKYSTLLLSITSGAIVFCASGANAQQTKWQWSGQVSAATEGVSKDVAETAGRGQLKAAVDVTYGALFAGAQWRNLREGGGIDGQQEYVVGVKAHTGGFDLSFNGGYKIKDSAPSGFDSHFVEWQGDISRTLASGTTLRLTDTYSADAPGAAKSDNFIEAGVTQVLNAHWSISGAVGSRSVTPKNNYNAVNLGVSYAIRPKTGLDLRYYDTDKHGYGDAYKGRVVLQLTQGF